MNQPTELTTLIPNWQRFVELYEPSEELIDAFIKRISMIQDSDIRTRVSGYINVELGILILSHREIDNKKIREILLVTWENT